MLGQKDDPDASISAKDAVAGVFGTRSEGVQEQSPQASNNATAKEVARSSKDEERKLLLERIGYIHNTF